MRSTSLRRVLGYGMKGAVGGAVLALVQHVGPEVLGRPALRWVFLYALLGGGLTGGWEGATRGLSAWLHLDRRKMIFLSGLLGGVLLFGATVLVSVVAHAGGTGPETILEDTPAVWVPQEEGAVAFFTGCLLGGFWRYVSP